MISRAISKQFIKTLADYPVLAMTGPRQSGKTTFLKNELQGYRYVTLENPDTREFAQKDPHGFLKEYDDKVILDEVQNTPQLLSYIQSIVDESKIMGQYILSGSQNFHLMESITQSLAGRVAMFRLLPFHIQEMKQASWLSESVSDAMTKGFYPAIFERGLDHDRYFANYIDTYVTRDVSQLINIKDNSAFRIFLKLCATRAGQVLNISNLARDAGVSHTTARSWLSILETSYILFLLPPYYHNFGKRLVKSPKLYFYDVGLLCHLLNIRSGKLSPTHSSWGHIFENMIVSEMVKIKEHNSLLRDYYYWRDSKGHEIDMLFQEGEALKILEIKASSTIQNRMFEGLDYFSNIADMPIEGKSLVYSGDASQKRTDSIVLSWKALE